MTHNYQHEKYEVKASCLFTRRGQDRCLVGSHPISPCRCRRHGAGGGRRPEADPTNSLARAARRRAARKSDGPLRPPVACEGRRVLRQVAVASAATMAAHPCTAPCLGMAQAVAAKKKMRSAGGDTKQRLCDGGMLGWGGRVYREHYCSRHLLMAPPGYLEIKVPGDKRWTGRPARGGAGRSAHACAQIVSAKSARGLLHTGSLRYGTVARGDAARSAENHYSTTFWGQRHTATAGG